MVFQNPSAQMLSSTVEGEVVFGLENLGLPPAEIRQRLDDVLVLGALTLKALRGAGFLAYLAEKR
jgi:energy-coupling factor transporter ATP-binding protein EcfA2